VTSSSFIESVCATNWALWILLWLILSSKFLIVCCAPMISVSIAFCWSWVSFLSSKNFWAFSYSFCSSTSFFSDCLSFSFITTSIFLSSISDSSMSLSLDLSSTDSLLISFRLTVISVPTSMSANESSWMLNLVSSYVSSMSFSSS